MVNISITEKWFNEVKDKVPHKNPYHIVEGAYKGQVEVDVDIDIFNSVSKELGWII